LWLFAQKKFRHSRFKPFLPSDFSPRLCQLTRSGMLLVIRIFIALRETFSSGFSADILTRKNVTQSLYRPGEALRFPGCWGIQVSRQSAYEGGKVVSPTHRPPLPPRKYSWYSFLLKSESISGPYSDRKDYVNEKLQLHVRESSPLPCGF
jgi:hypothetical protein